MRTTAEEGLAEFNVSGESMPAGAPDSITRRSKVVRVGFPISGSVADMVEGKATGKIRIAKDIVPGSLRANFALHTSTLSDLEKGLEGLLREPSGCFEQTSTASYPNTLVLEFLKTSDALKPETAKRAKELLDRGYDKLVGFECINKADAPGAPPRKGYEWFGGSNPPHEALTAYGLLQFTDMSHVRPVDADMLKRTREYLLGQRDGKGGFKRNPYAIDTFGYAPQDVTNAYVVWSLTESERELAEKTDLKLEIDALVKMSEKDEFKNDSYMMALVANSLLNVDRRDEAKKLVGRMLKDLVKDGMATGSKVSVVRSGGRDLDIEATGLTILATLKLNEVENMPTLHRMVKWVSAQRGNYGGFGSTQSTILALKALIGYTKQFPRPTGGGTVTLWANGVKIGEQTFEKTPVDGVTFEIDRAKVEDDLQGRPRRRKSRSRPT